MTQTVNDTHLENTPLRVIHDTLTHSKPTLPHENSFVENSLFSIITPLFYRERLRITFDVADVFKDKMALIRGIIEFNRTSRFTFLYDLSNKTIETDVHPSEVNELKSFLEYIYKLIENEAQFRKALRVVIAFENENKKLSAGVYRDLYATATVD